MTFITIICFLVLGFLAGFLVALHCLKDLYDTEDTVLLDCIEEQQIDLDVYTGRNTTKPEWRCYHPNKNADYEPKGLHTARDAIRDFIQKGAEQNL